MIGILVAIEDELKHILNNSKVIEKFPKKPLEFYHVKNSKNTDMIIGMSGAGKVNAALATSKLIENFNVCKIISSGIAGGTKNVEVNDILLANRTIYHDVNMSSYRNKYDTGQVRNLPQFFNCDIETLNSLKDILIKSGYRYKVGSIATGDKFINSHDQIKDLIDKFTCISGFDMESASIGQVCFLYDVPFTSLRIISDTIDSNETKERFNFNINQACIKLGSIVSELV